MTSMPKIHVSLPVEIKERLEQEAKETSFSMSKIVVVALAKYFKLDKFDICSDKRYTKYTTNST